MPAYTGPIPPTPTATSTDAAWHNWWTYQTIVQNLRYEDERAAAVVKAEADRVARVARESVLDQQHAEKMAKETACALAATKLAESQNAIAAAMSAPISVQPERLPTRAELVFEMVKDQPQATVLTPSMVIKGAADLVDAYIAKYPDAVRPVAPLA
jgi:hypothetical protein